MKTAIIGAGAIGSLFGSLLKINNIDAVLFDRDQDKINYIKNNGLKLIYPGNGESFRIYPEAESDIMKIKDFDYYLMCVKSYSTEAAAAEISAVCSSKSVIVTFQNGMGNVDILKKYFPESRIAAGTTSEGASFKSPGTVIYGGKGKTSFSIIDAGNDNKKLGQLITMLNNGGIDTSRADNYRRDIWKKLIVNAAINPLTAVLRVKNISVSESPCLRNLAEMIISESVKAAEADGIFFDYEEIRENVFNIAEKTAENRSSMLQDIENKRKTEIDYISGTAADRAEKAGIEKSVNRIMQNIIKVLENRYFT